MRSKLFIGEDVKFGMSCVKMYVYIFRLWVVNRRWEDCEENGFCEAPVGN